MSSNPDRNAIIMPQPPPYTIWEKAIYSMLPTSEEPFISDSTIIVSIYAHGSLLPLSISNNEAVFSLRLSLRRRNIEKTEAASVHPRIEPSRSASSKGRPMTKWQNKPTSMAVTTTPTVESRIARPATGVPSLHFVPKPP